jgi:general secretion pathway protein J
MNRRIPQQRADGFTLVELLLAVTLMSILLGLAYGGMRAATRATERGQEMLEASGSIRSTHQFIRRQLNQMQPLPFEIAPDSAQTRVVFLGDSRRIQFVGPMPGYLGQGGPQVQVLELVPGDDGDDLVFSHALLQEFVPEHLLERDPIVLLEDVRSGGFEFLLRDEAGELAGWTASWPVPDQLPVAVSLNLAFNEERQVLWPLMTTGIRVDEAAVSAGAGRSGYEDAIRDLIRNRGDDD